MSLTYGSMFSGYGGLDQGVQAVLGGETSWFAEFDAAPSKILAHHWPDVPNLGDVTKVDWAKVPKVDVLTGGFPCQDVSHAGKRLGLRPGTRTGLWQHMAYAVDQLRPRLVVIENVRGLLSATAVGDVEPCPWCVGDGEGSPMRALGCVLADLAGLGYDARWYGLRAADVGAPHGRFRVFVFATDTANAWSCRQGQEDPRRRSLVREGGVQTGWHEGSGSPRQDRDTTADAAHVGHERGGSPRRGRDGSEDPGQSHGYASLSAAQGGEHGDDAPTGGAERLPLTVGGGHLTSTDPAGERGQEVTVQQGRLADARGACDDTPTDTLGSGWIRGPHVPFRSAEGRTATGGSSQVDWGQYAPAIGRWERVLGRPAPAPTEAGPKGGQRLSPHFVEWLMGLPEGHVTGVKISRNDMLKALGNGVVPQQAAAATRMWLAHLAVERAS